MTDQSQKVQTVSLATIAIITLGFLLHQIKSFMVPFVLAVLLSFLLVPAASYFDRKKVPSIISNFLILSGFVTGISFLVFILYGVFTSITSTLPFYMAKYRSFVISISKLINTHLNIDIIARAREVTVDQIFEIVSPTSLVKTINQSVGSIISIISQMTLLFLFLIFIMGSRRILINKLYHFFHAKRSTDNSHFVILQKISSQIKTYLFLKTLISIGTGAVFGLVAFFMGLDFAIIWGFIGFVFNFIPTLGPIIASIPPIILAFLQFDNALWALLTAVLMSSVQLLSGNLIEPLIIGDRLNLNLIAILLSLLLWGFIWGIPGMLLAVPITASLNIIFTNIPKLQDLSDLLSN